MHLVAAPPAVPLFTILLEVGNEGKITFICWFGINKICLWVNGNRTKIIYHFLKIRLPVRSVKC